MWTSGPWFVTLDGYRVFSLRRERPELVDKLICVTAHNNKERTSEAKHNATLISASPDMFAALEQAYVVMLQIPHDKLRITNQSVFCAVRNSLAKATGATEEFTQNRYEETAYAAQKA